VVVDEYVLVVQTIFGFCDYRDQALAFLATPDGQRLQRQFAEMRVQQGGGLEMLLQAESEEDDDASSSCWSDEEEEEEVATSDGKWEEMMKLGRCLPTIGEGQRSRHGAAALTSSGRRGPTGGAGRAGCCVIA
jgi:hypothetical protein